MSGLLVTLPLHLACQLINPGNITNGNVTIVEDTSVPNHPTVLPGGYTAFPDVGMAYKLYANRLTWNAARKQCLSEGGTLAIVDSFKKVEHIMGIGGQTLKTYGAHTGIHRLFDTVEWTSIRNGQPLGFIPWKPDANISAGTGACVALWNNGSGVGPWNCINVLPAVCEIPLFKENRSTSQPSERLADILIAN